MTRVLLQPGCRTFLLRNLIEYKAQKRFTRNIGVCEI